MSEIFEILRPNGGVFWLSIGLVLAILEVLDGSFTLFSLGMGAAFTSVFAFLGVDSIVWLVAICAMSQLLMFLLLRPVVVKALVSKHSVPTNVDALVGKTGFVIRSIGGRDEAGYVKVQGEEWRAISANDQAIDEGTRVRIRSVSGATLSVIPELLEASDSDPEGRVSISKWR